MAEEATAEKIDPIQQALIQKEERRALLEEVAKAWNGLVKGLIQSQAMWEKYRKLCVENSISIEEFPYESQRILYKANPRGDFDLIVEDIITQPRIGEFLKTQFIKA
jgi:hypothetical protein